LGAPQSDVFGPGGALAAGVYRPLGPALAIGARLRAGLLSDGDPPATVGLADPGLGGFGSLTLAARLRPLALLSDDGRRATGPFVEAGPSAVLTGDLLRMGYEVGVGWGLGVGPLVLAPVVRFAHVLQPNDQLDGSDAHLLMFGVEASFFDRRPIVREIEPEPPSDRDGDGIFDDVDACPEEPEDADGFEDSDGCPDPDNDRDSILDDVDECPNEPEDPDEFEDEDGCPDPDNDGDGILDVDDQCPNEAEVVNGVDDQDGCPDEGLIEFVNDRIVLDSRVLFATDRAVVSNRARPILDAIITLWRQHPEWTRVRIEGHADYRGSARYNQRLSERRAANVMRELVRRGMPQEMVESIGYGATRLINRGDSPASLRVNRRVEFVVLSRRELTPGERAPAQEEPDAGEEAP
jgi:outer membrane protein OmpA-like peptidoglycan-associated protein